MSINANSSHLSNRQDFIDRELKGLQSILDDINAKIEMAKSGEKFVKIDIFTNEKNDVDLAELESARDEFIRAIEKGKSELNDDSNSVINHLGIILEELNSYNFSSPEVLYDQNSNVLTLGFYAEGLETKVVIDENEMVITEYDFVSRQENIINTTNIDDVLSRITIFFALAANGGVSSEICEHCSQIMGKDAQGKYTCSCSGSLLALFNDF